MKKIFLATVAAAALIGFAGAATAQSVQSPAVGGAAKPESTEHAAPGSLGGALNGNITGPGAAKAAQTNAHGAKPAGDPEEQRGKGTH
jgi:hypothetical protein